MCGTPGTVTGPGLPAGPEPRSAAGGAFRFYLAAEAHPGAVPHARRAARNTLTTWRLGHIADDVELVVSELVTNAVQATQAAAPVVQVVAVYLALDLDRLFVLVWDCCPQPPVHRGHAGDDAETGRGLEIVSAVADRWGTVTIEGGKVIWAQLALTGREAVS
jgi:anti-sigma regulatory factor (Ser/Thr protein kinase)